MASLKDLKTSIFADGADVATISRLYREPHIKGFTTNPTLMRKAGVADYGAFAAEVLRAVPDRPVSFEVFADDLPGMERQARQIASWGPNVYVKVPVTTTSGESTGPIVRRLTRDGVQLNVTAILTLEQVAEVARHLARDTSCLVSIFAGRIADTGVDPVPLMKQALQLLAGHPKAELLWASCRELLNIFQADAAGCHIITVTSDILAKLHLIGCDLRDLSLQTVRMFHTDALHAEYTIKVRDDVPSRYAVVPSLD
jgi:transaldolase